MPNLSKLLDMGKNMDMDEAEVEDMVAIIAGVVVDIILRIAVVFRVKIKIQTIKSGIIQRHNLEMG